ncbi:endonuclease domain-containing 1 protein-like [Apteryx mantelli]|uniref:Endonuclease domain-containing 1 protein-like n=1 Tax=Apteryx mantelli TaxID=2696672 RepID=A0ABM4FY59_9AVES
MAMLWLLGCLCVGAAPALAKVGSFGECRRFFYGGLEPKRLGSPSAAKICQQHRGQPFFATLYDRWRLVPHWSAYTLSAELCPGQAQRRSQWFVEPQLVSADLSPDMSMESECSPCRGEGKLSQALNEHYEDTAFVRGQLNPGAHQCGASRTATFALTNAVPLEPCFAHGRWRALQWVLRAQLRQSCPASDGGVAYVVTGATPGADAIPADDDREGDRERLLGQVTVPRHVWTAVCCDNAKPEEKFSLAFLAENKASSKIQVLQVKKLAEKLAAIHQTLETIEIFADDCNSQSPKTQDVLSAVTNALDSSLSAFPAEAWKDLDDPDSSEEDQKLDVAVTLSFSSMARWHQRFTKLHRQGSLACVLQRADTVGDPAVPAGTWAKECVLQEQKHLPGSMAAAEGWSCDRLPCDFHGKSSHRWCYTDERSGESRVPCCSSRCAAADGEEKFTCDRGDGKRIACSPLYSAVTIQGQPCRAGFPCGLYGKRYFWCYTDDQNNWGYCCAPQHFCGSHGYSYSWCYVGNTWSKWEYCNP